MELFNFLLIVLILISLIVFLFFKLKRKPTGVPKAKKNENPERFELENIKNFVADAINNFLSTNLLDLGLSEEEYRRREANVLELQSALKVSNSGSIEDKVYVKQFIFDLLLLEYQINEQNIDRILPFGDSSELNDQDKFEILLHVYKKKFGFKALSELITRHQLDRPKQLIEDGTVTSYIITSEEIRDIYMKEAHNKLDFTDKLQVIVQRIYQEYKGHGPIDDIRDMNIDGVSGGVSGLPRSMQSYDDEIELMKNMTETKNGGLNSIWIFFKGNPIHLSFLQFEDELELKRICQNIYKNDSPGQLTENSGFIVNDMKDGSRVVVVRPPFAESWAFWVRKFDLPNMDLNILISDESAENAELPRELIKFLMKSGRITAFTGPQGAGKTSVLLAAIKYIYGSYTLRIQELIFELHIRRLYPGRNSIAFRETDTITGQQALDLQKKTDGTVSILGEVASDEVASWAIKMGTVASKFLVFTAHPTSFENLIFYLRNALVNMKYFTDQRSAEEQVAKVIEMDVHLEKSSTGKRYIERITEGIFQEHDESALLQIQQLAKGTSIEDKLDALVALQIEDYRRRNERPWKANNIVEYHNGRYVAKEPLSQKKVTAMLAAMTPEDGEAFKLFLKKHWGHVIYDGF